MLSANVASGVSSFTRHRQRERDWAGRIGPPSRYCSGVAVDYEAQPVLSLVEKPVVGAAVGAAVGAVAPPDVEP